MCSKPSLNKALCSFPRALRQALAEAYAKAHRHPEFTDRTNWDVSDAERPRLVPYADRFHSVPASVLRPAWCASTKTNTR